MEPIHGDEQTEHTKQNTTTTAIGDAIIRTVGETSVNDMWMKENIRERIDEVTSVISPRIFPRL